MVHSKWLRQYSRGKKPKHTKRSCLWGTNLNSYFWISSVQHPPFCLSVNVGCSPSPAPTPLPLIFHPKPLVSEEWQKRTQASPLSKQSGGRPGRLPTNLFGKSSSPISGSWTRVLLTIFSTKATNYQTLLQECSIHQIYVECSQWSKYSILRKENGILFTSSVNMLKEYIFPRGRKSRG